MTGHERDRVELHFLNVMAERILDDGGIPEDWVAEKMVEVAERLVSNGHRN